MRVHFLCVLALVCGTGLARGQAWSNRNYWNNGGGSAPETGPNPYPSDPNAASPLQRTDAAAPPPAAPETAGPACESGACGPAGCAEEALPQGEESCKHRFWLSANYAAIFIKPERLGAPLLTTGSVTDPTPGALQNPNTVVLSADTITFGMLSGVQADAGVLLDQEGRWALQWSALYVMPNHERFGIASDAMGNPLLTRPVFSVVADANRAVIDAFPGSVAGQFNMDARTSLLGGETNLTYRCGSAGRFHADLLGGFRYIRLAEDLTITDQLTPLVPGFLTFKNAIVNPPSTLADMDRFSTKNNFYGLQLGSLYALERGRFFVSGWGKMGLGITNQLVDINGQTALITPTGRQYAGGGVLALPSNMGEFTRNRVGFVPEGGLTVGVNLTPHIQFTLGYSFLYWSEVIRPAGQLNNSINPNQIPTAIGFGTATGPAAPVFQFAPESFWMHNVNCGFTVHF
jgi:hypothetical protein